MPVSTAAECIDRASSLIRAAAGATSEDEKIRLLQDAEAWLQLAKQQLLAAREKADPDLPER
jgi:hypothetical protein